ncbi:MAG: phosphate signaling complex protein PhoU [Anaerolineales bacterium]|nr:phosphate signaling complex protein PhoU [Anaerolineales bacterium]
MTNGPRATLDRKMQERLDSILVLGSMVEQAITGSVRALKDRDLNAAQEIYDNDRAINNKRYEIEEQTLSIVATQQPMARDLRILSSVLDIAGELERMGDYAKGIARITIRLGKEAPLKALHRIPKMADLTADMLHRAVGSFVELDEETARAIPDEDDKVDELYNALYREILDIMFEDRSTVDRATFHLWVSHNLERAADRVTNICERTVFTVTGNHIEFDRSDDESGEF